MKLIPSSGNDSQDNLNNSQELLLDWLEKHLLSNSILECIKNLFLETWSEKTLASYKGIRFCFNCFLILSKYKYTVLKRAENEQVF